MRDNRTSSQSKNQSTRFVRSGKTAIRKPTASIPAFIPAFIAASIPASIVASVAASVAAFVLPLPRLHLPHPNAEKRPFLEDKSYYFRILLISETETQRLCLWRSLLCDYRVDNSADNQRDRDNSFSCLDPKVRFFVCTMGTKLFAITKFLLLTFRAYFHSPLPQIHEP